MYIQNRRDSRKIKVCSPLQNCNGLISFKSVNHPNLHILIRYASF